MIVELTNNSKISREDLLFSMVAFACREFGFDDDSDDLYVFLEGGACEFGEDCAASYDHLGNEIWVYYVDDMTDVQFMEYFFHEFTHHYQNVILGHDLGAYAIEFSYEENPMEIEAWAMQKTLTEKFMRN